MNIVLQDEMYTALLNRIDKLNNRKNGTATVKDLANLTTELLHQYLDGELVNLQDLGVDINEDLALQQLKRNCSKRRALIKMVQHQKQLLERYKQQNEEGNK